jgi:hypothetical protein
MNVSISHYNSGVAFIIGYGEILQNESERKSVPFSKK